LNFLPLAKSKGVTVYAQKSDFFSFFNSPYYSHINTSAVDIYPGGSNLETLVLSPVDGTVSKLYEFKSPRPKYFEAPEMEQLILITPKENPNVYVRLLHVNCNLQVGTLLSVGDCLGPLIRSGFFNFWTSRHLHIEIRSHEEPLRAKGGYPMEPINSGQNILRRKAEGIPCMRVRYVNENYALVELEGGLSKLGNFWGLECMVNNVSGILDCGIPHYCHGGVHTMDAAPAKVGDKIWLWGVTIGLVTQVFRNFIHFKCSPLSIYVNDFPIKGLSLYPWLREAENIKLIPKFPHDFQHLKIGENICLKFVEEVNM